MANLPKRFEDLQGAPVGGQSTISQDPYSMMLYTQMSPDQRAAWYQATGQADMASMWGNIAIGQTTVNAGLGTLQTWMAYTLESQPGVAPPPYTGGPIWWTAQQRVARQEELGAGARAVAGELEKRRVAGEATSKVRTSAKYQERAKRGAMAEYRGITEAAAAQAGKEEAAQARVKQTAKMMADQAKYQYEKAEDEKLKQAKLMRDSRYFQIAGQTLGSLAPHIGGAIGKGVAQQKHDEALAAQYGLPVDDFQTIMKARGDWGKADQALTAQGVKIAAWQADTANEGLALPESLSNPLAKYQAQRDEAYQRGSKAGMPDTWLLPEPPEGTGMSLLPSHEDRFLADFYRQQGLGQGFQPDPAVMAWQPKT